MKLSDLERRILRELQRDASRPVGELAEAVGAAQSTVWRRIAELDKAGLITARVALLDPRKAGVPLCVFATVKLADHSEASLDGFGRVIRTSPEILEAHAITGTGDYLLKIRCKDVEAYQDFMSRSLLAAPFVRSVTSSLSLKELKSTTELPI
ncbi:Lrp/AsnC family transcriptional regulator [Aestuariibius sp. 2305UL40-4]|uniref:Lrp/AsnC family transcriptional regulator n=1 Tax=Aestuariibius violaceus TaxID=3234132 RepID=UPI00345ED7E0